MNLTARIKRVTEQRRAGELYGPMPEPQPIVDRMGPFARRLRDKNLAIKELYNGSFTPNGDRGAA